jgi:hypothetical protein
MGIQSDLHITNGQYYNVLSLYCKYELAIADDTISCGS